MLTIGSRLSSSSRYRTAREMRDAGGMDPVAVDVEKNELLRVLDELVQLLRTWDEVRWAEWLERDRRLIADSHPDALGHLLSAFGGSDSLGDLAIHPANGHAIEEDRIRPVNDRLRLLRGAVFIKTTMLQRDAT